MNGVSVIEWRCANDWVYKQMKDVWMNENQNLDNWEGKYFWENG